MTDEDLRKQATSTVEWENIPVLDRPLFVHAYMTGAKPREKRIAELEKENSELKDAIKHFNPCGEWNDDVHDCEFRHYAMEYGSKLTQAKEVMEGLMRFCRCFAQHHTEDIRYKEAEQFLKEVSE